MKGFLVRRCGRRRMSAGRRPAPPSRESLRLFSQLWQLIGSRYHTKGDAQAVPGVNCHHRKRQIGQFLFAEVFTPQSRRTPA
jgi:hypothetical protein